MSRYRARKYKTKEEALSQASLSSVTVESLGITVRELLDKGFKFITCFDAWLKVVREKNEH